MAKGKVTGKTWWGDGGSKGNMTGRWLKDNMKMAEGKVTGRWLRGNWQAV